MEPDFGQERMKMLKKCRRCKILSEHGQDKKRRDSLQPICKVCRRKEGRAGYLKNSLPYKKRARIQRNKLRIELRNVVETIKQNTGCRLCGERETCCLDFHHVLRKDFHISRAMTRGRTVFKKEIMKCAVLCSNCHRKDHAGLLDVPLSLLCSSDDLLQAGFSDALPPGRQCGIAPMEVCYGN